ncbi:MAG: hypothetical protein EPO01_15165 [Aquabacterium sp.]|nr:MAG: hypothetical protein EPO01_15165 [Aquabacterium sp.]
MRSFFQHAAGLLAAAVLLAPHAGCRAATLCVWDPIGAAGPLFDAAKGYALAMQKAGTELRLKAFTDERVAAEDFRVGQCDALMATSIRVRPYAPVTAAIDAPGATTIVRGGKVDLDASYEVVRRTIQAYASPGAAKLVVQDRFEVGGIVATGALYMMARDRSLFTKGLAGKKLPAFDHDKVQAQLFQRIGAQPVASDISNFANKFNNGAVDAVFAPAVAFRPLEIWRGVGKEGGVSRFPLSMTTTQLVFDRTHFPAGFGEASRRYWFERFDEVTQAVRRAEADIPAALWVDYPPEQAAAFVDGQRQLRVDLARQGFYSQPGLKVLKRVRCSIEPAAGECATPAEIEW